LAARLLALPHTQLYPGHAFSASRRSAHVRNAIDKLEYMRLFPIIYSSLVVLAAVPAPLAAQRLMQQGVQGRERVCIYPGNEVGETRQYKVGLGERCPAVHPLIDQRRPVPPTARLQSTLTLEGQRRCIYVQGQQSWTLNVELDEYCPLAAGMLAPSD
jgi:hypothetical protein